MAAPDDRPGTSPGKPSTPAGFVTESDFFLTLLSERNLRFDSEMAAISSTVETNHEVATQAIDLLRDTIQHQLDEMDRRLMAAVEGGKDAARFALESADKATAKAETATEKRFDSVNEFRAQLKDQSATFIPRIEVEQRLTDIMSRLESLRTRDAQRTAHSAGSTALYGWLIGGIGALATILVIVNSILTK